MIAPIVATAPGADFSEQVLAAFDAAVATLTDEERALAKIDSEREQIVATLPRIASPWFQTFLVHDPREFLARVRCPVLAVIGSKDVQVVPEPNLPAIRAALAAGGNGDYEVLELPGLNHLFQAGESGAMGEYASIPETFDPAALSLVTNWILARAGRALDAAR